MEEAPPNSFYKVTIMLTAKSDIQKRPNTKREYQ